MRYLLAATLIATSAEPAALLHAQQGRLETLAVIDSIGVFRGAALSPNGKWVVFAGTPPGSREEELSLWISRVGSNRAAPLTSPGRWDQWPRWLPSGDKVLFVSNRVARGDEARYAMVLPIDTATGTPAGPPRQVTTEPTGLIMGLSADGRQMLFAPPGNRELRLASTAGGPSRVVARASAPDRVIGTAVFTRDGRAVMVAEAPANSGTGGLNVLRRHPLDGGAPVKVATHGSAIVPLGADPSKFLACGEVGPEGDMRCEVVDAAGKVRDTFTLRRGHRPFGYGRADGTGLTTVHSTYAYVTRVRSADGGPARTVATGSWPNAILPDGRIHIDLVKNDVPHVGLVDARGRRQHEVALPPDAEAMSWDGTVGMVTTFRRGRAHVDGTPVHAVDLATGRTWQLSARAMGGLYNPWRFSLHDAHPDGVADRFLLAEPAGKGIRIRAVTPRGASQVLRTFPTRDPRTFAAHGSRIAWLEPAGDSSRVMYASTPGATPVPLGRVPRARRTDDVAAALFSPDGRSLMVRHTVPGAGTSTFQVHRFDARGVPAGAPTTVATRLRNTGPFGWRRDGRTVVMLAEVPGGSAQGKAQWAVVSQVLEPGRPFEVLTPDEPPIYEGLMLSPDGNTIAYPVEEPGGLRTTISTVKVRFR